MYLSFKNNYMAELRISIDETYNLMLTEDMIEQFNYVDFIEDILSIRVNEYRNLIVCNFYKDGMLLCNSINYSTLEKVLREKGIFPKEWRCKITGLMLYLMSTDLSSVNRFYNTLLLLKRNNFFTSQYKSRKSTPLLTNVAPVFGKIFIDNSVTCVEQFFNTTLEMMFYDLIFELSLTKTTVNIDVAYKLLRRLRYPDNCYELLDDAINMDYGSFCNKHLDCEYSKIGTLQTIYTCLSTTIINNMLKTEVNSAEIASWYGPGEEYITSGDIHIIPMHIFCYEYIRDRFICQRYLTSLYEKYCIKEMYHITPNGVEGWIGLIVNKVLSDGYRFKKCVYCNSYSVISSQNICENCQKQFAEHLENFYKKDRARRKNKRDMSISKHDKPVIDFYMNLYDEIHTLLVENFTNMLKEECFDKQKPNSLDYELLKIKPYYIEDFRAQDDAEREILTFTPHSEYRYNLILELWSMYMIPKRFIKSIFDGNGFGNIENMVADFYEIIDIKKLDKYEELIAYLT